jgi:hypothetical protein
MANPWFRMYAEFAHDAKVQMMTEVNQRRLIMLFCLRCSNVTVTLQDKHVAFQLRISEQEWTETKQVFLDNNFIDEDNNLLNWDKRQFVSDSSAARVKRHRESKKNTPKRECNVTVTPPDTDTDTDTDKYLKEKVEKEKSPPKKLARQLPDDFCVTDKHVQKAIENDWPDPGGEIEKFTDYYASRGTKMLDWDRAFYGWLRKAKEFQKQQRGSKNEARKSKTDLLFEECAPGAFGRERPQSEADDYGSQWR